MRYWVLNHLFDAELVKQAEAEFPAGNWPHWLTYNTDQQCKQVCFNWHDFPSACWRLLNQMLQLDMKRITGFSEMNAMDVPGHDVIPDAGLWGAGMGRMGHLDFLNPHLDASHHRQTGQERKLTAILFLNSRWFGAWGGRLLFPKHNLGFGPEFNQLVVFENSDDAEHFVSPLDCPLDEARKTLSVFWYAKEPSGKIARPKASFL